MKFELCIKEDCKKMYVFVICKKKGKFLKLKYLIYL